MRILILLLAFQTAISFAQELPVSIFNAPDHSLVSCVAYSPDGKLATATEQGKIYVWNTAEKMVSTKFSLPESDLLLKVAFNKEANMLAAAGKNKIVYVWDLRSGVLKHQFKGHTETITGLSFSPDGNWIASSSTDKTVKIWSLLTNILGHEILTHTKEVTAVQFSNSGNQIVTSSYDGVVRVFSAQSYTIEKQFSPDAGKMRCVSFSPDDRYLAVGADDKTIKLYDFETGNLKRILKGHKNSVYTLAFSHDGNYLATGSVANDLIIWSMETTEPVYTYSKFYKLVDVSFSPDGKALTIADFNEQVKSMDISSFKMQASADHEKWQQKQKVGLKLKAPKIAVANPITNAKEHLKVEEAKITIKGSISAEAGLFMLLVGGQETEVTAQGTFEASVKLAYNENEIIIKAIDKDKKVSQDTVFVFRPFGKNDIASGVRKGKDYALLIGTNEYDAMHHLVNPVNDLITVATELVEKYDFQVEKLFNPTLAEIYNAVKGYGKKQYSDEDQLFIFIAGHGEYDPIFKEGYLVAKDTKKGDDARVTYLSYSNLRTLINNISCKHIMLTLDACFGGTFDQALASRGSDLYGGISKDEYVSRKMKYKTRLYLTSGGKEYVPDGRPGQHSPFARKFLEALRSNGGDDGVLTFSEMSTFVEKVTPEPRKGEFGDNEPGKRFFVYQEVIIKTSILTKWHN